MVDQSLPNMFISSNASFYLEILHISRLNGLQSFIWTLSNGTFVLWCLLHGTLLAKLARLRVVPEKSTARPPIPDLHKPGWNSFYKKCFFCFEQGCLKSILVNWWLIRMNSYDLLMSHWHLILGVELRITNTNHIVWIHTKSPPHKIVNFTHKFRFRLV